MWRENRVHYDLQHAIVKGMASMRWMRVKTDIHEHVSYEKVEQGWRNGIHSRSLCFSRRQNNATEVQWYEMQTFVKMCFYFDGGYCSQLSSSLYSHFPPRTFLACENRRMAAKERSHGPVYLT